VRLWAGYIFLIIGLIGGILKTVEELHFHKGGKFLDQLNDYELLGSTTSFPCFA
jgi:hypothetical protein